MAASKTFTVGDRVIIADGKWHGQIKAIAPEKIDVLCDDGMTRSIWKDMAMAGVIDHERDMPKTRCQIDLETGKMTIVEN